MSARHLKRDRSRYKQLAKNQKIPKANYTSKFSDTTKILTPIGSTFIRVRVLPHPEGKMCSSDHSHQKKKNILTEFGCSLTPKALKHSSDYSQKRLSNSTNMTYSRTRRHSEWVLSYFPCLSSLQHSASDC